MFDELHACRHYIDKDYHNKYSKERILLQNSIVIRILGDDTSFKHHHNPWVILTAGPMGCGKSTTIQYLLEHQHILLQNCVWVDMDVIRDMLPESLNLKKNQPKDYGQITQKESGYIAELCVHAALMRGRHVIIDGSLINHTWQVSYIKLLRKIYPNIQGFMLLHMTAPFEVVRARAKQRAMENITSIDYMHRNDSTTIPSKEIGAHNFSDGSYQVMIANTISKTSCGNVVDKTYNHAFDSVSSLCLPNEKTVAVSSLLSTSCEIDYASNGLLAANRGRYVPDELIEESLKMASFSAMDPFRDVVDYVISISTYSDGIIGDAEALVTTTTIPSSSSLNLIQQQLPSSLPRIIDPPNMSWSEFRCLFQGPVLTDTDKISLGEVAACTNAISTTTTTTDDDDDDDEYQSCTTTVTESLSACMTGVTVKQHQQQQSQSIEVENILPVLKYYDDEQFEQHIKATVDKKQEERDYQHRKLQKHYQRPQQYNSNNNNYDSNSISISKEYQVHPTDPFAHIYNNNNNQSSTAELCSPFQSFSTAAATPELKGCLNSVTNHSHTDDNNAVINSLDSIVGLRLYSFCSSRNRLIQSEQTSLAGLTSSFATAKLCNNKLRSSTLSRSLPIAVLATQHHTDFYINTSYANMNAINTTNGTAAYITATTSDTAAYITATTDDTAADITSVLSWGDLIDNKHYCDSSSNSDISTKVSADYVCQSNYAHINDDDDDIDDDGPYWWKSDGDDDDSSSGEDNNSNDNYTSQDDDSCIIELTIKNKDINNNKYNNDDYDNISGDGYANAFHCTASTSVHRSSPTCREKRSGLLKRDNSMTEPCSSKEAEAAMLPKWVSYSTGNSSNDVSSEFSRNSNATTGSNYSSISNNRSIFYNEYSNNNSIINCSTETVKLIHSQHKLNSTTTNNNNSSGSDDLSSLQYRICYENRGQNSNINTIRSRKDSDCNRATASAMRRSKLPKLSGCFSYSNSSVAHDDSNEEQCDDSSYSATLLSMSSMSLNKSFPGCCCCHTNIDRNRLYFDSNNNNINSYKSNNNINSCKSNNNINSCKSNNNINSCKSNNNINSCKSSRSDRYTYGNSNSEHDSIDQIVIAQEIEFKEKVAMQLHINYADSGSYLQQQQQQQPRCQYRYESEQSVPYANKQLNEDHILTIQHMQLQQQQQQLRCQYRYESEQSVPYATKQLNEDHILTIQQMQQLWIKNTTIDDDNSNHRRQVIDTRRCYSCALDGLKNNRPSCHISPTAARS